MWWQTWTVRWNCLKQTNYWVSCCQVTLMAVITCVMWLGTKRVMASMLVGLTHFFPELLFSFFSSFFTYSLSNSIHKAHLIYSASIFNKITEQPDFNLTIISSLLACWQTVEASQRRLLVVVSLVTSDISYLQNCHTLINVHASRWASQSNFLMH